VILHFLVVVHEKSVPVDARQLLWSLRWRLLLLPRVLRADAVPSRSPPRRVRRRAPSQGARLREPPLRQLIVRVAVQARRGRRGRQGPLLLRRVGGGGNRRSRHRHCVPAGARRQVDRVAVDVAEVAVIIVVEH